MAQEEDIKAADDHTHTQGGRHVKGVHLYVKVLNSSFQLLNTLTGLIKYLPAVLT